MKLNEVTNTESESERIANYYIDLAKQGELEGTYFSIRDDGVNIYQETDESNEEGESPDKYVVFKKDLSDNQWNAFLQVAKKGKQW